LHRIKCRVEVARVGYEDVNDAERLRRDPAMRWVVGRKAAVGRAASALRNGKHSKGRHMSHNEERFSLASRRTCAPIEPPAVEGATVS
jgi:hypothetical protein